MLTTSGQNEMWKNDGKVLSKSGGWQTSHIWLFSGQAPRGWKGTSSLANSASEGVAGGSWTSGWAWVDIKSNTILLQHWEGVLCREGGTTSSLAGPGDWQSSVLPGSALGAVGTWLSAFKVRNKENLISRNTGKHQTPSSHGQKLMSCEANAIQFIPGSLA